MITVELYLKPDSPTADTAKTNVMMSTDQDLPDEHKLHPVRDRKGLRLVWHDLEQLPPVPPEDILKVAITALIPSAGIESKYMMSSAIRRTDTLNGKERAYQITAGFHRRSPVWRIEVRARTITLAVRSLNEVVQTGSFQPWREVDTDWRLDIWEAVNL